jgi:uncharacterized protein YhbP (UPF0306 family)
MKKQPAKIAREIIETSNFLTLATTGGNMPWANAVFYASDKDLNLYFTSYNDSIHVQNILKNPNIAVAIFDSSIKIGSGTAQGVQMLAKCRRLGKDELPEALEIVYSKRFPDPAERASRDLSVERFCKNDNVGRVDHIYKITPEKIYILDKSPGVKDTRLEVDLP